MSLLNPGGQRAGSDRRIFGAAAIERHCNQAVKARDHARIAETSIAAMPHTSSREVERRRRQQERRK